MLQEVFSDHTQKLFYFFSNGHPGCELILSSISFFHLLTLSK